MTTSVGRPRQFRNGAEKQKAYRERKKQELEAQKRLDDKVKALRNSVEWVKTHHRQVPSIEVYRTIWGTYTYQLLRFVYSVCNLDEETFRAIEPELELFQRSLYSKIYRFKNQ